MTTQQMVPINQNRGLATQTPVGLEGMDDFTTADLEIPVLKIVNGVSRMDGAEEHIGQFWNSISGEFAKTVDVVILKGSHSRALFSGDAAEADRPECTSRDGVSGSTYGVCSQCEFNPEVDATLWGDKSRKKCNKGFTLFLYMPDTDEFAIFNAAKTNVAPVKKLNTQLALKLKLPLFGAIVTMGTEKHEEPGKKWFGLAPRIKRALEASEIAEYRQMSQALKGVQVKIVDGEEETVEVPVNGANHDNEPPVEAYEQDAPGYTDAKSGRLPF